MLHFTLRIQMAGILLIAHTPLASALQACAMHVYGNVPIAIEAIDVAPDQLPSQMIDAGRLALQHLMMPGGVLILTDLYGATPANLAVQLADTPHVAVLTGVNLPMLLRAVCYRALPFAQLVDKVLAGAIQGIQLVSPNPHTAQPTRATC